MDVEGGPGHAAGVQGIEKRVGVDERATSGVDDADPGLHPGEGLLPQEVPGLVVQGRVEREVVGGLEDLLEGPQLDVGLLGDSRCDERVVGLDLHPEGPGPGGHFAADPAETDHPKSLAEQLDTGKSLAIESLGLHRGIGGRDVAGEGEHETHRQLGGRDRVAARRVHHKDALAGRRGEIDVVDPDARPPDHLQALGGVDHLRGHLASTADEDGVVRGHELDELCGRLGLLQVERPALGPENLLAAVGQPFESEDAVAHCWPLRSKLKMKTRPIRRPATVAHYPPFPSEVDGTLDRGRCAPRSRQFIHRNCG